MRLIQSHNKYNFCTIHIKVQMWCNGARNGLHSEVRSSNILHVILPRKGDMDDSLSLIESVGFSQI